MESATAVPSPGTAAGLPRATVYTVPPSAGGYPGEPRGWSLIQSTVGYAWPSGHQEVLRAEVEEK